MEVPSQNLGTGELITSRGTSLIWTNGHERGGEKGRVTLSSGNFWSRFRLLSVSLLTNVYFLATKRWDFVSGKKKRKIGFQFVNYNYCDRWLMIKTIDHILFWENIDFRIFSSEEIIYFKKYQFMYESNHVVFIHILLFLFCFTCINKRIFFLFFEVLIIIANF